MLRMNAAHLFLSSDLSHALIEWADVNISHLNTLVVVNIEAFVDHLGRSLDSERLVWALGCRLTTGYRPFFVILGSLVPSRLRLLLFCRLN